MPALTETEVTKKVTSQDRRPTQEVLTLRLVPKRRKKKKAVKWAEDVVDNEGLGKKSSKRCCIFHKQRQPGDWDSDTDSESEECPQCEGEGPSDLQQDNNDQQQ